MTRQSWIDVDDEITIDRQCELAGVSRATLYARRCSRPDDANDYLLCGLLDEIYTLRPFYGSRRMVVELRARGYTVNRKCVQRLMRGMGAGSDRAGPSHLSPAPAA